MPHQAERGRSVCCDRVVAIVMMRFAAHTSRDAIDSRRV